MELFLREDILNHSRDDVRDMKAFRVYCLHIGSKILSSAVSWKMLMPKVNFNCRLWAWGGVPSTAH